RHAPKKEPVPALPNKRAWSSAFVEANDGADNGTSPRKIMRLDHEEDLSMMNFDGFVGFDEDFILYPNIEEDLQVATTSATGTSTDHSMTALDTVMLDLCLEDDVSLSSMNARIGNPIMILKTRKVKRLVIRLDALFNDHHEYKRLLECKQNSQKLIDLFQRVNILLLLSKMA
ncbi:hypothetical protein H0H93_015518, partial [Arthromyces matolae]